MATWSRSFASFTEFTDFAAQSQAGSSHENGEDWAGTPDFASALALARQGWESGAKRIGEISARIGDSIAPRTYREELDYSPVGPGTLDLDRYQMGHPESYQVWVDTEDTVESNRGFLHLVVNLSASAGIDAGKRIGPRKGVATLQGGRWGPRRRASPHRPGPPGA